MKPSSPLMRIPYNVCILASYGVLSLAHIMYSICIYIYILSVSTKILNSEQLWTVLDNFCFLGAVFRGMQK